MERGIKAALPATENLNDQITKIAKQSISIKDAKKALKGLPWPKVKAYERAVYEEMLIAEMYGRLKIEISDNGLTLAATQWIWLPFQEAIDFFKSKKIMTKKAFDKLDSAYKRKSFTVAKLQKKYHLEQASKYMDTAIQEGWSYNKFIKNMNTAYDSWGVTRAKKYHLETVYRTNLQGSYSHGRYRQQTTPSMIKRRPYMQYHTAGDSEVRPSHAELDGMIYPSDDPIWNTYYTPNGYSCRCDVRTLSERNMERDKLKVSKGKPTVKPDKGFDSSPKDWLK